MARLLVVHHSPTPLLRSLTDAVVAGAGDDEIEGVEVVAVAALEATAAHVLAADGMLLGTSANFGYMSGALKHFFDTVFLDVGGSLSDDGSAAGSSGVRMPYGVWVHGGHDVTGAVRAIESIVGALPWARVAPVLEIVGEVGAGEVAAAYELGATVAALLTAG